MKEHEKRYQVFISSTYLDLVEERKEVLMALLELNCIPAGMELFPASNEDQWGYIKKVIDESDYYIVIIGGRYGSTTADGISYTEKEYDYAVTRNIPILGFIHSQPEELPAKKVDLEKVSRKRLEEFKSKIQTKLCKNWSTATELGSVVSRSLIKTMSNSPAVGYVRGDLASDPELLISLTNRIKELEEENNKLKYYKPEGTDRLSQGTDKFIIKYSMFTLGERSGKTYQYSLSWDDIIRLLGPSMFDESKSTDLKIKIQEYIVQHSPSLSSMDTIDVHTDCFDTIVIQLIALGIIMKSTKKHTASDTSTYWTLTPYGEKYIMNLKAIEKNN